jgi:hypothetical protein
MITNERAAVHGAIVGVVVFFPGALGVSLMTGAGMAGALGIALFGSTFGGIGFGAMLGAVLHLMRTETAEEAELAALPVPDRKDGDRDGVTEVHRAA